MDTFNKISLKKKINNVEGSWMLKFIFYFTEATHEPLHSKQMKFGTVRDNGHTYKFIWIIILFDEGYK
jgi:hypothetical protein